MERYELRLAVADRLDLLRMECLGQPTDDQLAQALDDAFLSRCAVLGEDIVRALRDDRLGRRSQVIPDEDIINAVEDARWDQDYD